MRIEAPAKLNLCLFLGPRREDGLHELCSLFEPLSLADSIEVSEAERDEVVCPGVKGENLAGRALAALRERGWRRPPLRIEIEKRIPVAAGLGGGSSDAATALRLANDMLPEPCAAGELIRIAAGIGADVPFFLVDGPQLGRGDGSELETLDLPQDFWVLVLLPHEAAKTSTGDVYSAFDHRHGAAGFAERRQLLLDRLAEVQRPRDLANLPPNDLASSPLAEAILAAGAFRADVSGAGPALYGLFHHRREADAARRKLRRLAQTWIAAPAWYG